MRFLLLMIVLGFPLIDLYATIRFARLTGVPVWGWLAMSFIAGAYLLRNERIAFRANTIAAMHGEQPLLRGLLDSGRKVLAGVLFLLPGVISDLFALVLLALPLNVGREFAPHTAGGGKPIDGEFHRVD
ncbi:MAG: FxsA family protein [Betaproteobacteria bacterium]